ncbi:hypothetical protein [Neofamilia massiliensis]|uniref:hypothetical protein n=1 Tax=Neofamilia massiliensis TaxID=1673724 RepID=UPI0006BB86E0|nr:hypothetical protein [Neofamilia massiliensis]
MKKHLKYWILLLILVYPGLVYKTLLYPILDTNLLMFTEMVIVFSFTGVLALYLLYKDLDKED